MDLQLSGKTAVVSGSTAGIGYATALGLARYGAHVIVTGRTQARVDTARTTIAEAVADAAVSGFAADLTTAEGAAALVAAYPRADILVNNLGIFEPRPFEEIDDAE
jgi:NAD(P)-dependent dehydrogenase (short-subunit alcohol dehydrogenase family)